MNRVWIYQADRFLGEQEVQAIHEKLASFIQSWTAHGSALAGKAVVVDNLFVVIEVDESVAGVTGCSIDKSVHFIKSLGEKYNVDFFDRMRVAYIDASGSLKLASRNEFEELVKYGAVNAETIVYNNLIQQSGELATNWKIPFAQSWHARVF